MREALRSWIWNKRSEIMNLGIQLVQRIKNLHSLGFLHLDIKPSNIMADNKVNHPIFFDPLNAYHFGNYDYVLIDFGLVTPYLNPGTNDHIEESKANKFMGTPYFWSLSMAKTNVYSRRDDVESIIYTLSYLLKGKLPWDPDFYKFEEEKGVPEKGKDSEVDQIIEIKKEIDEIKVRDNLPPDMQVLFTYVRKLKFAQEPDYQFLIDTLLHFRNKALKEEGFKIEDDQLEWKPNANKNNTPSFEDNVTPDIQYKSIMSAIKLSAVEPNSNTITIQKDKTLNFSFYSASKDSISIPKPKDSMIMEVRK